MTSEIAKGQKDPPLKQMSPLCLTAQDPPTSSRCRRPPKRLAHSTLQASLPTWGQVKALCQQAQ